MLHPTLRSQKKSNIVQDMDIDYAALVPFAIITIFSPGPNNILAATMGIRQGYRKTVPFLLGIWTGFFLVFLLCMVLATTLLATITHFEQMISIVGACYILWLAYRTLNASYAVSEEQRAPLTYLDGIMLQLVNPKVLIFGLTLFSTFLAQIPKTLLTHILVPAMFATMSIMSTSSWTLAGKVITRTMRHRWTVRIVNTILAMMLVVIAIDLSGVWNIF